MKKIILLVSILLSTSFAFAQDIGTDIGLSLETDKLINYIESSKMDYAANATIQDTLKMKIRRYNDAINWLIGKKNNLEKQANVTPNPSCQKISQTLWEGKTSDYSTGFNVSILQNFLNKYFDGKNIPVLQIDGLYTSSVTAHVKNFQLLNNIKSTGAVGPITLVKINSMICGMNTARSGANVVNSGMSQNYSSVGTGIFNDDFNFDGLQDRLDRTELGRYRKDGTENLYPNGSVLVQTTTGSYVLSEELSKIYYWGERGYFKLNYGNKTIETGGSIGGGQYSKIIYKVIPGVGLQKISEEITKN